MQALTSAHVVASSAAMLAIGFFLPRWLVQAVWRWQRSRYAGRPAAVQPRSSSIRGELDQAGGLALLVGIAVAAGALGVAVDPPGTDAGCRRLVHVRRRPLLRRRPAVIASASALASVASVVTTRARRHAALSSGRHTRPARGWSAGSTCTNSTLAAAAGEAGIAEQAGRRPAGSVPAGDHRRDPKLVRRWGAVLDPRFRQRLQPGALGGGVEPPELGQRPASQAGMAASGVRLTEAGGTRPAGSRQASRRRGTSSPRASILPAPSVGARRAALPPEMSLTIPRSRWTSGRLSVPLEQHGDRMDQAFAPVRRAEEVDLVQLAHEMLDQARDLGLGRGVAPGRRHRRSVAWPLRPS